MLKNRNELTEELRGIVSRLAPFYRFWETCDGKTNYGCWASDNEGTIFENAVENGTNLFDFDYLDLLYPWTHLSSLWVSLCLKAALGEEKVGILEADQTGGSRHYFCEINVGGQKYYFDGMLVTDDYRDIFGVGDETPTLLNMSIVKAAHAYGDVEGTLMFATWCELNKIDVRTQLDGWEHPLVLVGSRDLDSLTELLKRREKAKKEFAQPPKEGITVHLPYSGIDVTLKPGWTMSKEIFFAELRDSVNQMAVTYKEFMTALDRYTVRSSLGDEMFAGKGRVMELVEKARNDGRLLYDGEDHAVRYWWTHGECNLIALMLEALLREKPNTNATVVYVVDSEDENVCANYHAMVRFDVGGDTYYADGLMFSQDYRDIYRGDHLPPKIPKKEEWAKTLFHCDPCGMVLFACWCEVLGLRTQLVLKDWEHPIMLSGDRDLDEYCNLLNARKKAIDAVKPKTLALAYKAGK